MKTKQEYIDMVPGEYAKAKSSGQSIYGFSVSQCAEVLELRDKVKELEAIINTPETDDFFKGVPLEAAHQRLRWRSEHDAGKTHADWFWLVGYLAGKCLHAAIAGDKEKALHHTISTAAALANWHMAIKGAGDMRPGIDTSLLEREEKP